METTRKLEGTIEEQTARILDWWDSDRWLNGLVPDGDYLETDVTVDDVRGSGWLEVPEHMPEEERAWRIRNAVEWWARHRGLQPYSRSEVIEEAGNRIEEARYEADDVGLELSELADLVDADAAERIGEKVRKAERLLHEALQMTRDLK